MQYQRAAIGEKIPDSTLQNPIRNHTRKFLVIDKDQPIPDYLNTLKKCCPFPLRALEIDSERVYGLILSDIYNKNYPVKESVANNIREIWSCISSFVEKHQMFEGFSIENRSVEISNNSLRTYSVKDNWENLRLLMQRLKIKKVKKWVRYKMFLSSHFSEVHVCQDFIIVKESESRVLWVLDYEQVMMIVDTLLGRHCTLMCIELEKDLGLQPVPYDDLIEIYKLWDDEFSSAGNSIYSQIKQWEPIIMGVMLDYHDPLKYASTFLKNIESEIEGQEGEMVLNMLKLIRSFRYNPYQLGEIHGIFRHWGHPTVNEKAGCQKVKRIARARKLPNHKVMLEAQAMFNRQFSLSFLQSKGRLPRMNLDKLPSESVLKLNLTKRNIHCNYNSPIFKLSDWGKIKFLKEFDFDYSIDFTDKIEDTSISPYLYDLPCIYAPEVLGYRPGRPTSNRRLILELLKRQTFNIEDICLKVMNREIPDSWKIILLSSKERELKIEPRLFAMMVIEMRMYFVVTEENLAKIIFKYFPQQSMTLNELELTNRLYHMASEEFNENSMSVFMSIDFKSWNIHWQHFSTIPIFSKVDELFGTPGLYIYSHLFFSESTIALSSRYNPPECLKGKRPTVSQIKEMDEDLIWNKHLGGFEGIRQKGWTLITIILLLMVEYKTGIRSYIIGQGDNQILKLLIPTVGRDTKLKTKDMFIRLNQDYLSSTIQEYIQVLAESADHFKLEIKKEESWVSSSFINYGKDILWKGAYLPQSYKRISRVMPDINDAYPTLSAKLSSIQTTGYASASKGFNFLPSYLMCQLESISMIRKEVKSSIIPGMYYTNEDKKWMRDRKGIDFLLHGGTNLFSVPILNILDYVYRGHPDPLTTYLTMICKCKEKCPMCNGILIYLMTSRYTIGEGDPQRLIDDPTDLNLDLPGAISNVFKSIVSKKMIKYNCNKHLAELFHTNYEAEDKKVNEFLISCSPVFPRLLHEIKLQTPAQARDFLISKFGSARTIHNLLAVEDSRRLNLRLVNVEKSLLTFWRISSMLCFTLGHLNTCSQEVCPTRLAQQLRDKTWKNTLGGRSINGVTIPHPAHQFKPCIAEGLSHSNCTERLEYILFNPSKPVSIELLRERGPYPAFHGSKTQEKRTGKIYQIPGYSRPIKAAQRIIQVYQWCIVPDEVMEEFLQNIIETRTDIPPALLKLAAGSIASGSSVHRLHDHITKRNVTYNMRTNITTSVYLSTDMLGIFSRGSDNSNMHISGAILYGYFLVNMIPFYALKREMLGLTHHHSLHLHFSGVCCQEQIIDVKISSCKKPPTLHIFKGNPLLYSSLANYPVSVTCDSQVFSMSKKSMPVVALSFLMLSQIIETLDKNTWLPGLDMKYLMSKVSLRIIIDIGIQHVLEELVLLLVLYHDLDFCRVEITLYHLSSVIWQNIVPICLLPEVLEVLFEMSGCQYQPALFNNYTGVSRMLTRASIRCLHGIKSRRVKPRTAKRLFYLVPGLGIDRIFRMWANWILWYSEGNVNITRLIRNLDFEEESGLNLPSKKAIETLENSIILSNNRATILLCLDVCKLELSEVPAEISTTDAIIVKPMRKVEKDLSIQSYFSVSIISTALIHLSELPMTDRSIHAIDSVYDTNLKPTGPRTFSDHAYHLFSNTSSSYLKIMEILDHFQIPLKGKKAACLADGTGSISRYLHKATGESVIFNTLLDTSKFLPHRAVNFIPSEFMSCPQGVELAELSALYGGDLRDHEFINLFIKSIPTQLDILTCDPEMDGDMPLNDIQQILVGALKVSIECKVEHFIFKTYINSVTNVVFLASIINTVYERLYVCVPCFSSNETYEIYLYSTGLNPVVDRDSVGAYYTNMYRSISYHLSEIQNRRISSSPHMLCNNKWKLILGKGRKMGFNNNFIFHLERLCNNLIVITSGESSMESVLIAEDRLDSSIKKVTYELAASLAGGRRVSPLTCKKGIGIHQNLDIFLDAKSNIDILKLMLNEQNLEVLQLKIENLCSREIILRDNRGSITYSYIKSFSSIKRDHLRSLWCVWGHLSNVYVD